MPKDNTERLLNAIGNKIAPKKQPKKLNLTKRRIHNICERLSSETQKFDLPNTIEAIDSYLKSKDRLERILYSEISNYIYSLEPIQRGVFITNIDSLLSYSLNEQNNINEDTQQLIIKIYDHSQLALHQIENVNNIFANSIAEAKENLQNQVKNVEKDLQTKVESVEKEYITILGVFAAIVLAFVGGITFSTSVLQNISAVSVFRLLLIVDFLAFVLINIIYMLISLVFTINEKDEPFFNITAWNKACLIIAVVILASWILNINQIPNWLSHSLPWSR